MKNKIPISIQTYGRAWKVRLNQMFLIGHFSIYFEWLNEGIEKDSNTDTSSEQFYQPGSAEELQKSNLNYFSGINDTAHHRNEIKSIPRILEIILKKNNLMSNSLIFFTEKSPWDQKTLVWEQLLSWRAKWRASWNGWECPHRREGLLGILTWGEGC